MWGEEEVVPLLNLHEESLFFIVECDAVFPGHNHKKNVHKKGKLV